MKGVPSPNIKPHPRTQKAKEEAANTMKFLERMFTQFLAWHMPDSTKANPRFMKNTNIAVTNTHVVSMPIFRSARVACAVANCVARSGAAAAASAAHDAATAVNETAAAVNEM